MNCFMSLSLTNDARQLLSKVRRRIQAMREQRLSAKLTEILNNLGKPDTSRAEKVFAELQSSYSPRTEYGYDPVSVWHRAATRSLNLVSLPGLEKPGKQILDIGAGDGMLGAALNAFGHCTTLVDQDDWRHDQARDVTFKMADCCGGLPFPDTTFDLVCSFNSFEHFRTPENVCAEIARVVKPGGWIYVEFGPLYWSPWGLHAYRTLRMPYPQLLFSEKFISEKLQETGVWDLGKRRTELQFLNKWKINQFDRLWDQPTCKIVSNSRTVDTSELGIVLQFPEAFRGRGLSAEDLTVSAVAVSIQKR
jgi:SAM-dependent methyltransferase